MPEPQFAGFLVRIILTSFLVDALDFRSTGLGVGLSKVIVDQYRIGDRFGTLVQPFEQVIFFGWRHRIAARGDQTRNRRLLQGVAQQVRFELLQHVIGAQLAVGRTTENRVDLFIGHFLVGKLPQPNLDG